MPTQMHRHSFFTLLAAFIAVFSISACKPRLIPNSSVRDTSENRAVMKFLDEYKVAVEKGSVPDLMALVSPDYYETNATPTSSDDYGYSQLEQKLQKTFARVKSVMLRFHVQNIQHKNDKVEVYYYFNQHILADFPAGEEWMAANDVNRLVLRPKGKRPSEGYLIVSGL